MQYHKDSKAISMAEIDLHGVKELYEQGWEEIFISTERQWQGPKAIMKIPFAERELTVSYIPEQTSAALLTMSPYTGPYNPDSDLILVSDHNISPSLKVNEIIMLLMEKYAKRELAKCESHYFTIVHDQAIAKRELAKWKSYYITIVHDHEIPGNDKES